MITLKERYILDDPLISAGSGIALHQGVFYIVADDELGFLALNSDFKSKGKYLDAFPGKLPEEHLARKKTKPDIESIMVVENKLLLLPSGSKPNRNQGALFDPVNMKSEVLTLKKTYEFLEARHPELNIEGAVMVEDRIHLFQRGNGKLSENGIIKLSLNDFLKDEVKDYNYQAVNLGTSGDTPYTFTDATMWNKNILFLAAAEKTQSTYDDGDFAGAILGVMDLNGKVLKTFPLEVNAKPEGICVDKDEFFLVTDDDNRKNPSRLFSGELSSLVID